VVLEWLWPKRRILEVYLNISEFGDGIYGVSSASQTFFGKRPVQLQPQEAALLAAVLPNPTRFHVQDPSAYVRERAGWIEEQMAHLGGPAYLQNL
jgi:monofunctional biosynthetic peptidoglycan transglycosylase